MAFGDSFKRIGSQNEGGKRVSVSPFLTFNPGDRFIRILGQEVLYYRYYLRVNIKGSQKDRSIVAGGFNNPIRDFMESIGPEDPRYRTVSQRFYINVIDRTLVKITSQGIPVYADENGVYPDKDPITQEDISSKDPAPHNQIRILETGKGLMDQLDMIDKSGIRDPKTLDVLGIHDFDVKIRVRGRGKEMKKFAMADTGYNEELPSEVFSYPRYDLHEMTKPMPEDAIRRILDGEDYIDVISSIGREIGKYPMFNPVVEGDEEEDLF